MDGGRTSFLFLPGCRGPLFAAHDAPAPGRAPLGAVLQLSPFAEEMNRARHLLACQARELAAAGLHVLRVDPYGCGDSAGDFSEARWEIWREDALRSADWLREETSAPVSLWGVRLGALLACDLVAHMDGPPGKLVLGGFVQDEHEQIKTMVSKGIPFEVAEYMVIGTDHAEVGARILEKWDFPRDLVNAVNWHHDPETCENHCTLSDIVHIANTVGLRIGFSRGADDIRIEPAASVTDRLGLGPVDLDVLTEQTLEGVNKLSDEVLAG